MRGLVVGLTAGVLLLSGEASAFDLTGAWASERDACRLVYQSKAGVIDFTPLSDLYGSGFIVNGKAIRGKAGKCTIRSKEQDGDTSVLTADCASSIMTSTLRFRYKVLDDNTLVRDFPEVPGMTVKYSRCPI